MLVNSKLCLSEGCSKAKQYESKNHFPFMRQFVFGSGIVMGTLSKNNVYMGDNKLEDVFFYEILAEQDILGGGEGLEGIVGLGFDESAPTPNLFDYAVQQKNISNLFSFYLNQEEDSKSSKIIFGGIQNNLFSGELKYYNSYDEFYWTIDMEAILVGDKDTGLCSKENKCRAIIDTGTSFIASNSNNILKIASYYMNQFIKSINF